MQRSPLNHGPRPILPSPTIPLEALSRRPCGSTCGTDDEPRADERRRTDPGPFGADAERARPPEELFALRSTERIALQPKRDNLHIAVAAFVITMLFSLIGVFFWHRLQLEQDDGRDMHPPATRTDAVLAH